MTTTGDRRKSPNKTKDITCDVCSVPFKGYTRQRYCSESCRKKEYQRRYMEESARIGRRVREDRECDVCDLRFTPNSPNAKYCSHECRAKALVEYFDSSPVSKRSQLPAYEREEDSTICPLTPLLQSGYYVYGWYDPGSLLPFYIGKGMGDRVMRPHLETVRHTPLLRIAATAELRRTAKTRIVIYRRGLTAEGAMLVESVLIDTFRGLGADLVNKVSPLLRTERPPLEIVDATVEVPGRIKRRRRYVAKVPTT